MKSYESTQVKHFHVKQRLSHSQSSGNVSTPVTLSHMPVKNCKDPRISELMGGLHRLYLSTLRLKCALVTHCGVAPFRAHLLPPFASSHGGNGSSWWRFVSLASEDATCPGGSTGQTGCLRTSRT